MANKYDDDDDDDDAKEKHCICSRNGHYVSVYVIFSTTFAVVSFVLSLATKLSRCGVVDTVDTDYIDSLGTCVLIVIFKLRHSLVLINV